MASKRTIMDNFSEPKYPVNIAGMNNLSEGQFVDPLSAETATTAVLESEALLKDLVEQKELRLRLGLTTRRAIPLSAPSAAFAALLRHRAPS